MCIKKSLFQALKSSPVVLLGVTANEQAATEQPIESYHLSENAWKHMVYYGSLDNRHFAVI